MENDATKTILPSKEALNEFLKAHKYKSFPTAVEATRNGKKLVFIFLDNMSKQRLINAIPVEEEMREFARRVGYEATNECESTAEYCADMVSEAPTVEPSNRWVRTADRMPDIPGDEKSWAHVSVIAAERGSKKSSPMIYERAVIRGKTVYRWKYVWDRIYDGNDIFAWMPYPEAPKEEENE